MNKSTPISQLPLNNQGNFVNEQQQRIVTEAQNAVANMNLPQNSQHDTEVSTDEDAAIQEVLNQINMSMDEPPRAPSSSSTHASFQGGTGVAPSTDAVQYSENNGSGAMRQSAGETTSPPQYQPYPPPQASQPPKMGPSQYGMNASMMYHNAMNTNVPTSAHQTAPMGSIPMYSGFTNIEQFIRMFGDDIKMVVLIIGAVVAAHFIPFTRILGPYLALDRIPYHDIIFRAVFSAFMVMIVRKMIHV